MTLKNSFLADVSENMKRRNWVFWISFLTFFCYFPGALVLCLNNIKASYRDITNAESITRMNERMKEMVDTIFCVNEGMPLLLIAVAVLIGMQGFVYLHNKRQVDFYHSQPVSRKRRFFVLWLNGILVFAGTYLINMILGMVVTAVYGMLNGTIVRGAFQAFGIYFVFFLGIYHIAILAVVLTGNTLVSLLAMIVLLGYEFGIRGMKAVLSSTFFLTYGNEEAEKMFDTLLSPIVLIYKYIIEQHNQNVWQKIMYTYGKTMFGLLALAVIFGIISFILYVKRASESHGNSISFPKIKEPLRFLLLLLIGIFGSYMIYIVAGENIGLTLVGTAFFVGLGHAVIQLIYEVDFRAIRKKWLTAGISFIAVVLIFLGFKYDWTGYDYKIPKQEKVESVYVSLAADSFCGNNYILKDGSEIYGYSYAKENMKLTDLDTIYELLENRRLIKRKDYRNADDMTYEPVYVIFRMKDGETISRRLYLNYEENMGVLNEIYHMEEYQKLNNQVMEENFVEEYQIVSANYNNGIKDFEVPSSKIKMLLEAYRKDVEKSKYAQVYYQIPIGKVMLKGIGLRNVEYRNQWEIVIYDSYKNTLDILKNSGIQWKAVFDETYVKDITKISVEYSSREKMGQGYLWEESHKSITYQNKEMFAKILEKAVPASNRWWVNNHRYNSEEYYMFVFKPHLYDENYNEEIYFQPGELPDFILKDLEKVPYGEEIVIE